MAFNPLAGLMGGGPGASDSGPPSPTEDSAPSGGGDIGSQARQAITLIQQMQDSPETDAVEDADLEKCIVTLKGLLAGHQKQKESALGTTPAHKFVARASGNGGNPTGY